MKTKEIAYNVFFYGIAVYIGYLIVLLFRMIHLYFRSVALGVPETLDIVADGIIYILVGIGIGVFVLWAMYNGRKK